MVHHCPALSDAARHVPGAEIDWVVEEAFAAVPAMHPCVRRVIPVAVRRWRAAFWNPSVWSEIGAFRRSVRRERYDLIIDSQGLLKSAVVSSFARGPIHGMDRASTREPLASRFYDVTHRVPRGLHAVERNRLLAAQSAGYAFDLLQYGLRPKSAASPADGACAVFLTMTSRADKLWPESHWIELGRALGMKVVLPWGSDEERSRAQRIADGIGEASVPERMTLEELSGLLALAGKVVGIDTGLTHLSAALGTRTIGIFCGSDPSLTGLFGSPRAANVGGAGQPPSVAQVMKEFA